MNSIVSFSGIFFLKNMILKQNKRTKLVEIDITTLQVSIDVIKWL